MSLTQEELLAAADGAPVRTPLPGGKGEIYLRPLTCDEMDRFEQLLAAEERRGVISFVVTRAVLDAQGGQLFAPGQEALVGAKPAPLFVWLTKEVLRLSKVEAEDIERLEKN